MKLHFVIALAILIQYAGAQCTDTWFNPDDSSLPNMTLCNSCSGECHENNGCSCGTSNDFCLPNVNVPCSLSDVSTCCPNGVYYDASQSCCTTSSICYKPCTEDETCINGECQCNTTYYQNPRLSDFHPTISCDINTITVRVSKCELEELGLDSSTIHLRDSSSVGCNFPYSESINGLKVTAIQAATSPNWCGNTVTDDDSNIYISNTIYIGILNKPIITTNNIRFNITCVYNRNMQTVLKLPGNITQQMVFLSGANGIGSYPVTMAAYKNPAFTEAYQNNDEVPVGTTIYVGIFVTGADGNQYVLRIESCVASPTDDRSDVNAFYLIKDGCVQETVPTTVLENSKSLEAAFSISSFQFQNQVNVFLFCDVRLCDKTDGTCSGCASAKSFNTATNEVKLGLTIDAY